MKNISCSPELFRSCWNFVSNKIPSLDIRPIFWKPLCSPQLCCMLEQSAPNPGIFFPPKHSQKHKSCLSTSTELEKAQPIACYVKLIGQVEGVFSRRWTDGNISLHILHFLHQLIAKHFGRLGMPSENPRGLFFFWYMIHQYYTLQRSRRYHTAPVNSWQNGCKNKWWTVSNGFQALYFSPQMTVSFLWPWGSQESRREWLNCY